MNDTTFTDEQYQQLYPDGIENHYWNHARNAIILHFIKRNRLQHEKILEIGSGRGIVVNYLQDKGLFCTGVEKARVKPVKGIDDCFYTGTDAFDLPEEIRRSFTVVLLLDVIEHFSSPELFLQQIRSAFPHVRHIVVTVPARQELWTNFDLFNGHFKRYSLRDLKELSPDGIHYVDGRYFNHVLYPVFLFYAKWIRKRETVLRAPAGWQVAIHRVLSFVLQADYLLLPAKWLGTSCIALYSTPYT